MGYSPEDSLRGVLQGMNFPDVQDWVGESWEDFFQFQVSPSERDPEKGLHSLLSGAFPVASKDGRCQVDYICYTIGGWECLCGDLTGENPLPSSCPACMSPSTLLVPTGEEAILSGISRAVSVYLYLKFRKWGEDGSLLVENEEKVPLADVPVPTDMHSSVVWEGRRRILLSQLRRDGGIVFRPDVVRVYPMNDVAFTITSEGVKLPDATERVPLTDYLSLLFSSPGSKKEGELVRLLLRVGYPKWKHSEVSSKWFSDRLRNFRLSPTARKNLNGVINDFRKWVSSSVGFLPSSLVDFLSAHGSHIDRFRAYTVVKKMRPFDFLALNTIFLHPTYTPKIKAGGELIYHRVYRPADLLLEKMGYFLKNALRLARFQLSSMRKRSSLSLPSDVLDLKTVHNAVYRLLISDGLCETLEQTNTLAASTHSRRLTMKGEYGIDPGPLWGESKRRVHASHVGRICPIETPERRDGLGVLLSPALFSTVREGNVVAPFYDHEEGELRYLSSHETSHLLPLPGSLGKNPFALSGSIVGGSKCTRYSLSTPEQLFSFSASLIPFLFHDEPKRALVATSAQKQALPLLSPRRPSVYKRTSSLICKASSSATFSQSSGTVLFADAKKIIVGDQYSSKTYNLYPSSPTMRSTVRVSVGDEVVPGDLLADGPSSHMGEMALGRDVSVAFLPWRGANHKDAVVISEKMAMDFRSIRTHVHRISFQETHNGPEIPLCGHGLDSDGVIKEGAVVKRGDVLVGRRTPRRTVPLSPEEALLSRDESYIDTSLKAMSSGTVVGVWVTGRKKELSVQDRIELGMLLSRLSKKGVSDETIRKIANRRCSPYCLPPPSSPTIRRVVVEVAKIVPMEVGDKICDRHGNKGVVSKILPMEDMPFTSDGSPVDLILSPLSVVARLNVGELMETHAGRSGVRVNADEFSPIGDGKEVLYDGMTGDPFDDRVLVGRLHVMRLYHTVDRYARFRSTGVYSPILQQPGRGDRRRHGGQKVGEMETWALMGYGAAYSLFESSTVKSDDVLGRNLALQQLVKDGVLDLGSLPPSRMEALRNLVCHLRGLGLNLEFLQRNGGVACYLKGITYLG